MVLTFSVQSPLRQAAASFNSHLDTQPYATYERQPRQPCKYYATFSLYGRWPVISHQSLDSLISVAGFLDSIVSAKQNAAKFGYSISPNRELVALGASNLVGSLIPGTLPAYGSITRSVESVITTNEAHALYA